MLSGGGNPSNWHNIKNRPDTLKLIQALARRLTGARPAKTKNFPILTVMRFVMKKILIAVAAVAALAAVPAEAKVKAAPKAAPVAAPVAQANDNILVCGLFFVPAKCSVQDRILGGIIDGALIGAGVGAAIGSTGTTILSSTSVSGAVANGAALGAGVGAVTFGAAGAVAK
jgi:hypothetical protein